MVTKVGDITVKKVSDTPCPWPGKDCQNKDPEVCKDWKAEMNELDRVLRDLKVGAKFNTNASIVVK